MTFFFLGGGGGFFGALLVAFGGFWWAFSGASRAIRGLGVLVSFIRSLGAVGAWAWVWALWFKVSGFQGLGCRMLSLGFTGLASEGVGFFCLRFRGVGLKGVGLHSKPEAYPILFRTLQCRSA